MHTSLQTLSRLEARLVALEAEFRRRFPVAGIGAEESSDSRLQMELSDDFEWRYLSKKDCAGILLRLDELEKRLTRISGLVETA